MWAPRVGKAGQSQAYWTNMTLVQPGDLIFSGVDNAVRALSQASNVAYEAPRPDPRDEAHWQADGWRLDVVYTDLPTPLFYDRWVPSVADELPAKHSPFTTAGRPNQGYLFGLPIAIGEYLLVLSGAGGDIAQRAIVDAPPPTGGETVRDAIVKARVGQGQFRKDLIDRWGGRCAVTGLDRLELLRASHIKPWTSCDNIERLDSNNGLLLSAAYDAAFDALLISFASDGAIVLAPDFSSSLAVKAGIDPSARLAQVPPSLKPFLEIHRRLFEARVRRQERVR